MEKNCKQNKKVVIKTCIKPKFVDGGKIDIDLEDIGVEESYDLGRNVQTFLWICRGKGKYNLTSEQEKKLVSLGLITDEEIEFAKSGKKKKTSIDILLDV